MDGSILIFGGDGLIAVRNAENATLLDVENRARLDDGRAVRVLPHFHHVVLRLELVLERYLRAYQGRGKDGNGQGD